MQPIIDMQGIVKRYYIGKPNELEILHGIDLQVYPGEFVAIVGESGSGKSTLMNIIGALDRPTEGSYTLDGVDITCAKDRELSVIRNRKIGFSVSDLQPDRAHKRPEKCGAAHALRRGTRPAAHPAGKTSCWRW